MNIPDPALEHVYTTTVSGVNIGVPGHFKPSDVRLPDILRGLAMTVRFNGQLDRYYSVAEHSVLVARIAASVGDTQAIIPALLHDAHEAYVGDIARPIKMMVPGFVEYERQMQEIVREALGLPGEADSVWARVHQYDNAILHREMLTLRKQTPDWYDAAINATIQPDIEPVGLPWRLAEGKMKDALADYGFKMPFPS
jgi:hypothetical protein